MLIFRTVVSTLIVLKCLLLIVAASDQKDATRKAMLLLTVCDVLALAAIWG